LAIAILRAQFPQIANGSPFGRRVQPIGGGPVIELPPGEAQIRNLSWNP
jgi:hypothetical protein